MQRNHIVCCNCPDNVVVKVSDGTIYYCEQVMRLLYDMPDVNLPDEMDPVPDGCQRLMEQVVMNQSITVPFSIEGTNSMGQPTATALGENAVGKITYRGDDSIK